MTKGEARDLFFTACLLGVLGESQVPADSPSAEWLAVSKGLEPAVGFIERAAPLVPRYAALFEETMCPIRDGVRTEPLMLGWAYQIWNEDERARSTWAVSRRGECLPERASVSAATQLFTEEYMTRFLVRNAFGSLPVDACELFDPACGVGHFLVEAIRNIRERSSSSKAVVDFVSGRLFGVDIDPHAVELCRVIVWLEVRRYAPEAARSTWTALQSSIRALPSEMGSLDRRCDEPLLNRSYRCVATNPPYLGRRKLTGAMRAFLDREYPDAAADLCAAFLQRCVELLAPSGSLALATADKWLRLASYSAVRNGGRHFPGLYRTLRIETLCELGERAFRRELGLHDGVRILLTVARYQPASEDHCIKILDVTGCSGPEEKAAMLESLDVQGSSSRIQRVPQRDLSSPEGYEVFDRSKLPRALRVADHKVRDVAEVIVGLQTNDDRRLVRFHWEVVPDPDRWRVHNKGGGYGRWFGLNRFLLDWASGRPEFESNPRCGIGAEAYFERTGWTYTWFANGCLGLRRKERGWSFGRAASSGFFCEDERIVAFLNSRFGSLVIRKVGGKIQLPEGTVRKLPIPAHLELIDPKLVAAAVTLKRSLVSREPTDACFRPDIRMTPQEVLSLEVVLLLVEAQLEQSVERCLACSTSERDEIRSVLGVPVACFTCSDDGKRALNHLWNNVPEEFRWIRGVISEPCEAGSVTGAQEARVVTALMQRRVKVGTKSTLPADTRLEFVCRESGLHPLDVYHLILSRCVSDLGFSRAFVLPHIADEIFCGVAEVLGHRWWSEGGLVGEFQPRGIVALDVVTDHVCSRVLAQEDAFGCFTAEEILGCPLSVWLGECFAVWQGRRLFQRPLAIASVGKGGKIRGFQHVWDLGK